MATTFFPLVQSTSFDSVFIVLFLCLGVKWISINSLSFSYWLMLLQSARECKRLPESLFPHTYNPKMSLDISTVQDTRLSSSFSKPLSTGKPAEGNEVWRDKNACSMNSVNSFINIVIKTLLLIQQCPESALASD